MSDQVTIDLKEQLQSLLDMPDNLSIGQIGAIQWAINQVAIPKMETTTPITLTDKVKKMAHCAIDAGIIDAADWSAEIIRKLEEVTS